MQFEGSVKLRASREEVWKFVTDPVAVGRCIPALESLEPIKDGREYRVVVKAQVGPTAPTFDLSLVYTLVMPPSEARLRIRGKGGAGSHIGASSYMVLRELSEKETEMQWSFVVAMTGQLATVANRFVEPVFQRLSKQFLAAVDEHLSNPRNGLRVAV